MLALFDRPLRTIDPFWSLPLAIYADHVPLKMYMAEDEITLTADLPGLAASDLDVSFNPETGVLRATGKRDNLDYVATATIRTKVEASKAKATCSNGVLTIKIPRAADAKTVKIKVSGAV